MPEHQTIRIFISSPADVRPERLKAEQIVARLDREFAYHFRVEAMLWEREPLVATHHFQDEHNLTPPSDTDIVVVILWSRLGLDLPLEEFQGAISGRRPVTGTEWEFEDALAAARANGVPDLLLYQKTARRVADLDDDRALTEARAQRDRVEDFMGRWFRSADGRGLTAASHSFETTVQFEEQLYENLRSLLARRAGGVSDGVAVRWHEAPFRGLLSFEFEHSPVFFGRTRARNEMREALARQEARGCAFMLVMGASGSGKSSLVKAGLLPDLMLPGMVGRVALVRYLQVRPSDAGTRPIDALAASMLSPTGLSELAGLRYTAEHLAALLNEVPRQLALPIEQGLAEAGKRAGLTEIAEARLVIIVDQLEELFTLESVTEDARTRFVAALDALARSGLVWVVATMRSDFYDRIEVLPGLTALAAEGAIYRLTPPNDAELGQIIRQPALEAGLRFETDARQGLSLDEVIRQDAAANRGALPLLSFLLDQLWQRRNTRGELTFAAYTDLGGLQGALGRRAAEIFDGLPQDVQASLPRVLRALITVGQGMPPVIAARPIALDRFAQDGPERRLIAAFVAPDARLLVAAEGDEGSGPRIRVAHEALLTHWDRAVQWIAERPADLQLEERIEAEAERWAAAADNDKPSLLLRAGLPLTEAEALLNRRRDELADTAIAYIEASSAAERQRLAEINEQQEQRLRDAQAIAAANRRIAQRTMVGLAIAVVLAIIGIGLWRYAEGQRHEADLQREEAVKEKTLAQNALAAGTATARAMVDQLAGQFRGARGIRIDLIKDILVRAKSLLDQLDQLGEQTVGSRIARVNTLAELSDTYLSQGDIPDAESLATQAQELADALVKEAPQSSGVFNAAGNAYAQLASVRFRQAKWDETIRLRTASADYDRKCFDLDKSATACLDNRLVQLGGVADVYFEQQRFDDALTTYRKAMTEVDELERFEKQQPERISYQRASLYRMIGDVLVEKGDFQGALTEYDSARALEQPAATAPNATGDQQYSLASLYIAISATYGQMRQFDQAMTMDNQARQILEPLVVSDPQNLVWRGGLEVVYQHLAVNSVNVGRRADAVPYFRQFAAQAEAIYKIDPNSALSQEGEADALLRLVEIGDQPRSRVHDAYTMLMLLSRSGRLTSDGNTILNDVRQACGAACSD